MWGWTHVSGTLRGSTSCCPRWNERTRDILGKKEMNVKREERKRKEKKKWKGKKERKKNKIGEKEMKYLFYYKLCFTNYMMIESDRDIN
jgi:hypothetical protein